MVVGYLFMPKTSIFTKHGLFRMVSIYVSANVINATIPFLATPIFTHYMTPAEYGIISIFQTLVGLTIPFIGLNLQAAISRNFFEQDKLDFSNFIGNCFLVFLASSILVGVIFILFGRNISTISKFPQNWLWAVFVVSMSQFLIFVVLTLWQVNKESVWYGLFRISQTLFDIGFTLFLVIGLELTWQGRIEAQITVSILFAVLAIWCLIRMQKVYFTYNIQYAKKALKYGIPLIPHTLSTVTLTMIDRILIANILGLTQLGLYSVGYQIGMIIGLIENSFNQAWIPWFFEKLKHGCEKDKVEIVRITYVYFIAIIIFSLVVVILSPWFLDAFFDKKYYTVSHIVIWIAFGYAFDGMYKMVVNYIFYIEKTHILSCVTLLSAIMHIIFNIVFITEFGIIGAAYATMITFFLKFIMVWKLSSHLYKMPWLEALIFLDKGGK